MNYHFQTITLKGTLLICGQSELSLAKAAWEDGILNDDCTLMDLGSRVSRKKDFIPEITKVIKNGWLKPKESEASEVDLKELGHLEVDPLDPYKRVIRRDSVLQMKDIRKSLLKCSI